MQQPVMVLNTNTKRESGKEAQIGNIAAAKAVSDIIRTTLGPRSMLKMLLDPMGGIVMTNDGNCILREVDVSHPAAKSMIELSRAQDEEVGDGTTSVIILSKCLRLAELLISHLDFVAVSLSSVQIPFEKEGELKNPVEAILSNSSLPLLNFLEFCSLISSHRHHNVGGEILSMAEPLLARNFHPTVIIKGYGQALQCCLDTLKNICRVVDTNNTDELRELVMAAIGTKFSGRWGAMMVDMAIDAVRKVVVHRGDYTEVDVKRYVRVEKIPGGELNDCKVLDGVMFNKDVTHAKMRRRIEKPRVLLLDCPLEYKKGESQTNVEIMNEDDFSALLRQEEDYVEGICNSIIAFKPDIVITEKGVSDLAQHYFLKAGITAFRRLRKTDCNRVARAVGATIVNRPDEIQESDIGQNCGLFEVRKIGDEYFAYLEDCKDAKACTVLLRGGSKDVLNEIERNLQDAMQVVRNVMFDPRMLPGGGATEMALCDALAKSQDSIEGISKWPYASIGTALEVIPRTLAQNCGANVIRLLTDLRTKHSEGKSTWGVNGTTGESADMTELGIWEPYCVKAQTLKTAVESSNLILRIDDVVSGTRKKQG